MSRRILVTGASGFAGYRIAEGMRELGEVHITQHTSPVQMDNVAVHKTDLAIFGEVDTLIEKIKPTHLIHCAAITNVEECEKDWGKAYAANVRSTMRLARGMKEVGGTTLFLSTDLVFGGERGNYREQDMATPLSNYGWTKVIAESHVSRTSGNNCVLRCALIYGKGHGEKYGFLGWMRKTLEENKPLRLYQDEYRTPLYLNDLVSAIKETIEKKLTGTYHLAGRERINRYDFGVRFANTFGLRTDLIEAVSIEDHRGVPRPADVSLNIDQASGVYETDFTTVRLGLKALQEEWGS